MWEPYYGYWIKFFDLMLLFFGQILVRTIWFYYKIKYCYIIHFVFTILFLLKAIDNTKENQIYL
jgi:hypothetical protein